MKENVMKRATLILAAAAVAGTLLVADEAAARDRARVTLHIGATAVVPHPVVHHGYHGYHGYHRPHGYWHGPSVVVVRPPVLRHPPVVYTRPAYPPVVVHHGPRTYRHHGPATGLHLYGRGISLSIGR
jgi:hypothetical protein